MGIRKSKSTTSGQRHKVIDAFNKITASTSEKSLVVGKKSTGGRNSTGKVTARHIGGGRKQKYRIIDFKRNKNGIPAIVEFIEYDSNRSFHVTLLCYAGGAKSYIIALNGLEVGQAVVSSSDAAPEVGNTLPITNISVGVIIHNTELRSGQGAKMVRSADAFAQLTSKGGAYVIIKMPSGEIRKVPAACKATIGAAGNSDHALKKSGKAGHLRWLGRRPHDRDVVMSPVDHPMGGDESRSSGGHPRSRNGLYAESLKTRAPKKHSSKCIIERKKK